MNYISKMLLTMTPLHLRYDVKMLPNQTIKFVLQMKWSDSMIPSLYIKIVIEQTWEFEVILLKAYRILLLIGLL